jgi:thiamine-monophosphate kinase
MLDADWLDWALAGGEDHALVATFPAGTSLPEDWTVIGAVRPGSGVLVNSRPRPGAGGWNHFR